MATYRLSELRKFVIIWNPLLSSGIGIGTWMELSSSAEHDLPATFADTNSYVSLNLVIFACSDEQQHSFWVQLSFILNAPNQLGNQLVKQCWKEL